MHRYDEMSLTWQQFALFDMTIASGISKKARSNNKQGIDPEARGSGERERQGSETTREAR